MKKRYWIISGVLFSSLALSAAETTSTPTAETSSAPSLQINIQKDTKSQSVSTQTPASDQKTEQNVGEESTASPHQIVQAVEKAIQGSHRRYMVNIKVDNGVVVLKGYVNTQKDKQEIEKIVSHVQGVKNVRSELEVRAPQNQ